LNDGYCHNTQAPLPQFIQTRHDDAQRMIGSLVDPLYVKALPATITLDAHQDRGELLAVLDRYAQLCAAAYQLAGLVGAPVRFLDALGDGASGELGKRFSDWDNLLPVDYAECDEIAERDAEIARLKTLCGKAADHLDNEEPMGTPEAVQAWLDAEDALTAELREASER
jgi:hypothetical protein